jgi:hypothetical protein
MQKEFDVLGFNSFIVSVPETRKMLGTILPLFLSYPAPKSFLFTPKKQHGFMMNAKISILTYTLDYHQRIQSGQQRWNAQVLA